MMSTYQINFMQIDETNGRRELSDINKKIIFNLLCDNNGFANKNLSAEGKKWCYVIWIRMRTRIIGKYKLWSEERIE